MDAERRQRQEEQANTWTHLVGLVCSVIGSILLLTKVLPTYDWRSLLGVLTYASSLMLMFTTSTLMHSLPEGEKKERYIKYDHMAIYLCIAGTYTPFLMITVQTEHSMLLLAGIWVCAGIGVLWKYYFTGRYVIWSTLIYLLLGWSALWVWGPLQDSLTGAGLVWLLAGGAAYSIGTIFFLWRKLMHHHAIWHVFVILGAACHYVCMWQYVFA